MTFNVFEAMKFPFEVNSCFQIDVVEKLVAESFKDDNLKLPLEACITKSKTTDDKDPNVKECARYLEELQPITLSHKQKFEELGVSEDKSNAMSEDPPKLELKPLLSRLKYAYLGDSNSFPVIINANLSDVE